MIVRSESAAGTRAIAAALASALRPGDVVVLSGDLGAGKTTFVQGVAAALGVTARVTSPTFVLVRNYHGRMPIAHVDVYRLDTFQELFDLGYDELFAPDIVTLIEWGDAVAGVLPDERLEVRITDRGDHREIGFVAWGAGWRVRLDGAGSVLTASGSGS